MNYHCPCGYVYSPQTGCPEYNIPPGIPFEALPDDWICPRCGYEKECFVREDQLKM